MLALFLGGLFTLILINVPIAFSLIACAVIMMLAQGNLNTQILTQSIIRGIDSFPLLAIPFFMIAGEIMNEGKITQRIVDFATALVGHITGGMGYVAVVASMIFAGVSGSGVADTSAVGSVLFPIMEGQGYNRSKSIALICTAGCIGPIIPPSVLMILYGVIGEVSVVRLFLGGIIPGILVGLGLMAVWYFHAKEHNYPRERRQSLIEVIKVFFRAFWAVILPIIILGTIVAGIATPTEAAVVAVVYAFIVSKFVYKNLDLKKLPQIIVNGCKGTAIITLVVGGATTAAYLITTAHIPELLANTLLSISKNPIIIMLLINILLLLVGCVMDAGAAILILAPILIPLVVSLGLNPIYFGVVMVVNLCIGLATPPVGAVLYVGCGISRVPMTDIVKAIVPFILVMIVVLFIITYIPGLIMFIPNLI